MCIFCVFVHGDVCVHYVALELTVRNMHHIQSVMWHQVTWRWKLKEQMREASRKQTRVKDKQTWSGQREMKTDGWELQTAARSVWPTFCSFSCFSYFLAHSLWSSFIWHKELIRAIRLETDSHHFSNPPIFHLISSSELSGQHSFSVTALASQPCS